MNHESQLDANVTLYFVVPSKYASEDECAQDMWMVYDECIKIELQPQWISEVDCNKMTPTKTDIFVMEDFKGETFDKLKSSKCSIIGPRCLLACIVQDEPIPTGPSPVFTNAMKGLCVCASGIPLDTKKHVEKLVSYMGGYFTNQLRASVTHLVTESVMSAKYENATEMKITIVKKEWVDAVWNASLQDFVKADDNMFDKYKAPAFLNLIVTSTNLSRREKDEIKRLINENGGTFMGPLDGSKVKVVVAPANSPISEKLKYAKQANIACLTPDWVYESVRAGYAVPFKDFLIQSLKACSTPEKSNAHETFNCSTISMIPSDYPQKNFVEDTLGTTVSNISSMESISGAPASSAQQKTADRITYSEAKAAGTFLDGCNIYLAGFASGYRDKLNRILNVSGGTRLDDISDAITHVIIGDENKAASDLKLLKSKGLSPFILTLEWIEESIKLKRPAPEENFLFETKNNAPQHPAEPPSPLSKKNLQMLQKPRRPPIPSFNIDRKMPVEEKSVEPDLLQQYLQDTTVPANDSSMHTLLQPRASLAEADKSNSSNRTLITEPKRESLKPVENLADQNKNNADDSEVPISQLSTLNDKLFEGMKFVVTGFSKNDTEVLETIMAFGGQIVPSSFSGIPDYGIVPKFGAPLKHTVNEIVTDLFIDDCVNQEAIVDIDYYHRPISLKKHAKPLSDCVITMSMYSGAERTYLTTLAMELGAMCQEIFARKTNLEKNTHASTHLVCRTPEGNKYNAAVKWKLPAVTANWLLECASQLRRVDETPYLVGETIAPERPKHTETSDTSSTKINEAEMPGPAELPTRSIKTPKRHFPAVQGQDSGSGETPLRNKRLSLVMNNTPQSPFHVSTPESPYGQVFRENPSPDTRKWWAKWIDNLPDLRVEEPPLRRRAPSTPLSELKRQLMEKLKNEALLDQDNRNNTITAINNQDDPTTPHNKTNADESIKSVGTTTPINRKLDYADETSPAKDNEINLQIAHLDQMLEQTGSRPESRCSLSGNSAHSSKTEPTNFDRNAVAMDSQPVDAIVWEDPNYPKRSVISKDQNGDISEHDDKDQYREQQNLSSPEEMQDQPQPKKKPKFMLSCIKDRTVYEKVIRDLGGDVSLDPSFDDTATHLLCTRPLRNEKMLSSIASGKWVLHCLYLRDSERKGEFLNEEEYEWGNPKSEGIIPAPSSETERAIAQAAYKWRLKMQKEPIGPFHDMTALLLVAGDKYEQFKRLIEAGGGKVVQARPPYDLSPSGRKITHCFVSVKQVSQPIDWATLANKGILCFLPQYLHDHLTSETPLNPRERVIPEFRKYLTLLPK